ncbi:hypothetical protein ACV331_34795, partial [Pseudomonas aeruginosa]
LANRVEPFAQGVTLRQQGLPALGVQRHAIQRFLQGQARLNERCEQLNLNLEEGAAPLEELRMKLEELLERRMAVEDELKQARLALEDADRELREVEKRLGQAE